MGTQILMDGYLSRDIWDKKGNEDKERKSMGSQLFFQIVSPFFQIGSFVGLRYHDFFKRVSRLLQIILSLLKQKVIHFI